MVFHLFLPFSPFTAFKFFLLGRRFGLNCQPNRTDPHPPKLLYQDDRIHIRPKPTSVWFIGGLGGSVHPLGNPTFRYLSTLFLQAQSILLRKNFRCTPPLLMMLSKVPLHLCNFPSRVGFRFTQVDKSMKLKCSLWLLQKLNYSFLDNFAARICCYGCCCTHPHFPSCPELFTARHCR